VKDDVSLVRSSEENPLGAHGVLSRAAQEILEAGAVMNRQLECWYHPLCWRHPAALVVSTKAAGCVVNYLPV